MKRWDDGLFLAVGIALVLSGVTELFLGITGGQFASGVLAIGGELLLWRGIILLPAGVFLIYGALSGLDSLKNQARVFMGSMMIWIVAGIELLGTLLEAIQGAEEVWVASTGDLVAAMGPPYSPAVIVLPFTLVAFRYTKRRFLVARVSGGI